MDLVVNQHGHGPRLTFVHGWAMHGGLFRGLFRELAEFTCVRVDLPGHGRRREVPWPESETALAANLLETAGPGGWLVGWSLGGQLALAAARQRPGVLAGLILIAATPCFVRRTHWRHGVAPELLDIMIDELDQNPEGALQRFLALEVHGSGDAGRQLRVLKHEAFRHGLPDAHALHAGLNHLRRTDLTADLTELNLPVLVLGGRRDRLVGPDSLEATASALPRGRAETLAGAAHAPFLTHAGDVADRIRDFIHDA